MPDRPPGGRTADELPAADDWDSYVLAYHDANPGITEDVLTEAVDTQGRSPYEWLVEAVPVDARTVVDLACGSGPVSRLVVATRVVGVDRSVGELAEATASVPDSLLVQARADALPLATGCADAVVVSMAMMLMCPVGPALAEAGRVLRTGGVFAATVPVRSNLRGLPPAPVFAEILTALGQGPVDYPSALDGATLAESCTLSGLTVRDDATALFTRTLEAPEEAERVVRSFYAPGAGATQVASAVEGLRCRLRVAPVRIGWRIRRVVAVR